MKKNQIFTVHIESSTPEGFGICRLEGRAVFVQGTLEGEEWEILILKVTNTVVFAKGLRCISQSIFRKSPDCLNSCGGCSLRHVSYDKELEMKRGHVDDCFRRIGGLDLTCSAIHSSPEILRYRNKAIFSVAFKDGKTAFGFYRPRSHSLVSIEDCLLQSEHSIIAAKTMTDFMNRYSIRPFDEISGKGTVRNLYWRESRSGDAVLTLVSTRGFGAYTELLIQELTKQCPFLTGIVLLVNKNRLNTILDGEFHTLWGNPDIRESFCGFSFRIAPQAFLQINPPQAEAVYKKVRDYSGAGNLALDLYCGAGTISLCLSSSFKKVVGAEIVEEAVNNARENAIQNAVENVSFLCADITELAEDLNEKPQAVIVDPPRKGLNESVIRGIVRLEPEKIVYVSCNPATLARDLCLFADLGYSAKEAEAFDMFPRTAHIETIVLLQKLNS